MQYEYRYAEGERYYLASLRLNENDAPTCQRLSFVRGYLGHAKQALADMQRAQQIEPTTLSMNANVGLMLYFNRAYAESKARIESALALDSHYDYAHSLLGRTLLELGDIDDMATIHAALGETAEACAAVARAPVRAGSRATPVG